MARYREYLHGQVRELLTTYGEISYLFYDFSYPKDSHPQVFNNKGHEDWGSAELLAMTRELQPGIVVNDRLDVPGDLVTPEQYQPAEPMRLNGELVAWEACQTINGSWGYYRDNTLFKTPEMLVRMLVDGVAKGGNLLFNVGPTGRGTIDPVSAQTLAGVGEWMRLHEPLHLRRRSERLCSSGRLSLHPTWRPALPPPVQLAVRARASARARRQGGLRPAAQRCFRDRVRHHRSRHSCHQHHDGWTAGGHAHLDAPGPAARRRRAGGRAVPHRMSTRSMPDRLGRLGLGAASLGNLFREISDEQARAVVDAAWVGGVRYFDTAPHYGLGLSERRLGAALRDRPR